MKSFVAEKNKISSFTNVKEVYEEGKPSLISKTKEEKSYLSDDKKALILEKLTQLNTSKYYLKEDVSLSALAAKIGINQRYLSYAIKEEFETDFATYINTLRINYIKSLLQKEPKFLDYKISFLAEKCGYASHSRFTINFKKIAGETPSEFIKRIKEEHQK